VDFIPTEDQEALRGAVRDVLARDFTREHLQAAGDAPETVRLGSFRLWNALAEMGVFTVRLPESEGGLGGGLVEAALILEELGKSLVPGPLVGTMLAAGRLPDVEPGAPVGVLEADSNPLLVEHFGDLAALVVLDGATVRLVHPADVDASQVEHPLDPLTPVWSVSALPAGAALEGDAGNAAAWRRDGAVLTAALQAGIAAATTDLAVAYAKQREQFGKPIGAFQAVKHICADMFARAELATVAVEAAAASVDQPGVGDADRAAQVAKLLADEAASANSRACVQVHGGMGFTWEVVAHFYLKRAWVHATQFGSEEETSEALAQSL
jgi:alkylation response protein AidB-like acyl-CoA dehydrogenase